MVVRLARLLLIVLLMLQVSCAQKIPDPVTFDTGLIAIPMRAWSDGPAGGFNYYYSYSGTVPRPFEIRIIPEIGRDFVLSQPLEAGEYVIDTYTVYGVPSINMMLAVSREKIVLDEEIRFMIEPGVLLMTRELFLVTVSTVDYETYIENSSWKVLDQEELAEYLDRLKKLEGADHWKIVVGE